MFSVNLLKLIAYLTFFGSFIMPLVLYNTSPLFNLTAGAFYFFGGIALSAVFGTLVSIAESLDVIARRQQGEPDDLEPMPWWSRLGF